MLEEEGIHATVLDMFSIKPFDTQAVLDLAEKTGAILTVEEASIYGGLGGETAEVLAQNNPVPMKIMGIPDEDVPNGSDTEVLEYLGLGSKGICGQAKALIARKK